MATVIDELIVKLGLDATGLRQGQATAAGAMRQLQETFRHYSDNIQRSNSTLGASLLTLRLGYETVAIAALAAFAKVEQFATKIAAQNVTLAANAAAVRETTEEYSALGRALEAAIPGGGSGFARTVQNITNALAETRYTGKPTGIAQAAITFGLPLTEQSVDTATGLVRRHYKDAQRLAFDFIDKLKAQGKDYADAVWWAERYGIDKTLVYMRYKLTEEQQRQISAQGELNKLTQAQADASERLWIQWQGLEGTIGRVGNVVLEKFEKQFSTVIKYATSFADLFASKIIPGVAAVWDHLNKSIPEDSWMRKWDFGLLGYLKSLVDKLTFVDKILDKVFGEGTSKKTPLADVGKTIDETLGTGPGGPVDKATGGAISNFLGRTPPPEVGTPGRPAYEPLYPHQGYTPPAPGAGTTGPQSALPPQSGGVDRSRFAGVVNDPALVYRMADMVAGEVGKSAPVESQKVMLETMFNRAQRRDISVQQALLSVAQDPRRGYYARDTYRNQVTAADLEKFKKDVLAPVLAGSDYARGFTGNASGSVALHQRQRGTPAFPIQAAGGQTEWIFDEDRKRAPVPHLPQTDAATRPPVPAVGDTRWNGAPLSAISTWGMNGGMNTTNNDNSRSSEVNIGVFNQNVGSSTMVGSAQDFMGAVKESSTAIQGVNGPQ